MQRPHQQIVILSQVMVDDVNTGFQGFQNLQVRASDRVEGWWRRRWRVA
jgi:hypothetical protein